MNEDKALLSLISDSPDLKSVYYIYKRSLQTKNISYIPFLVDINKLATSAKDDGIPLAQINQMLTEMDCDLIEENNQFCELSDISTINVIEYAERIYKTNKMTNKFIKTLREELQNRNDLFDAFISYIANMNTFKSELYFWQPDLDICDVCTLVISLFNVNNLVKKYKDYMKECVILCRNYQENLLRLLNERYKLPLYSLIDVMKKDIGLYKVSKIRNCVYRTVSHEYWCDECGEYNKACKIIEEQCKIELKANKGDYSKIFRPCLSYVEVELNGKMTLLIPVSYLDDLQNGCTIYKQYWFDKNVTDINGNIII